MPDNLGSFTQSDLAAFVESQHSARDAGGTYTTHRKYSTDDPPTLTWSADHTQRPVVAITVAPDGTVYTAGGNTVRKWNSDGEFQWSTQVGSAFLKAWDLASDSNAVYAITGNAGNVAKFLAADPDVGGAVWGVESVAHSVQVLGANVYTTSRVVFFFGGLPAATRLYRHDVNGGFVWLRSLGQGIPVGLGKSSTHLFVLKTQIDQTGSPLEVRKVADDSTVVWTTPLPVILGGGASVTGYGFATAPDGTSYFIDDQGGTISNRILRIGKVSDSGTYLGTVATLPNVTIDGDRMPLHAESSGDIYAKVDDVTSWGKLNSSGVVQWEIDDDIHPTHRIYEITQDTSGNLYAAGERVIDPF